MKRKLILFVAAALILLGGFYFFTSSNLSTDQQELIDLWGYPDQFQVSYMPKGEDELIRSEVWYYHDQQKQVQFLAGKTVVSSPYQPESDHTTTLKPEDFNFSLSKDDVEEIVGESSLDTIDFLPGISDEETPIIFISPQAIFTIEYDHLTYIETIGLDIDTNVELSTAKESITETPTPTPEISTSSYHSDFLGFSTSYPQLWFLTDDILTTYDMNHPVDQVDLPEKFLKCDFIAYNPESIQIENPENIQQGDLTIQKGEAKDLLFPDGPGLGDGVVYQIKNNQADIILLCYAYHPDFESELIQMLKTITFDPR